jgi:hypothetical protein
MLDNPEKTSRLLAELKAAASFDVELTPALINYLRAKNVAVANQPRQTVSDLSYAGDEGGIMCHLSRSDETGQALVVSLTHVHVPRFHAACTSSGRPPKASREEAEGTTTESPKIHFNNIPIRLRQAPYRGAV